MPGSPACKRAYHERFAPGRLILTRGCSIPYPSVTISLSLRLLTVSKRARFSGCAIAPTNCRAESRGSCVSVSSVMTYFTFESTAVSPTTSENRSLPLPRSNEFRSASFPRLRSWPIQVRSCGFQRRGRWKRKKASPVAPSSGGFAARRYFSFRSSMLLRASPSSDSSSGIVSAGASWKSVSRPKCRWSS